MGLNLRHGGEAGKNNNYGGGEGNQKDVKPRALRGTGLVALHAWTGPVSTGRGDMLPLVYDPTLVAAEEERVLAEALAGWQGKYPDVTVHRRLVRGHTGRALVEATRDARLVVVGRHGHRAVSGWLVGSVTHALLHQARCPVAVIRHG